MKKILVTGAAGFIGSHVVMQLLKSDCLVIATSHDPQKAMQCAWFSKVQYIPFNLENFDPSVNYRTFFNTPDAVIHLAWQGLPNYKSLFHFEINLPVHYAFLKNLVSHGVTDITVTGTCFEYGMQEGCLTEELPAAPANAYALAKDTLRRFMQELCKVNPFFLKWTRLFYMYGNGQNPNSLLSQLDKALANGENTFNMSGGEQVRDYLTVEKVAEYIAKIALQNNVTGIINCCSGEPVAIRKLVEDYLEKKHTSIALNTGYYPYPDYEPMSFWGDDKKLKTIINYE